MPKTNFEKYLEYLDGKYDPDDLIDLNSLDQYIQKAYNYEHHDNNKLTDFDCIIINDFPIDFVKELLDINFNTRDISYPYMFLHYDLIKYLYTNWNNKDIKTEVERLKNHLIDTSNGVICGNRDSNALYYTFWLYAYYPLLDNGEELILKLLETIYLNDAHEYLMLGILQMDSKRLERFYKKFLIKASTEYIKNEENLESSIKSHSSFNPFFHPTGALYDNILILKKIKNSGIDLKFILDDELNEKAIVPLKNLSIDFSPMLDQLFKFIDSDIANFGKLSEYEKI